MQQSTTFQKIDWYQQWKEFAPGFVDGIAHIDLKALGGDSLLMEPGAGFGDFSHPTTRLMLSMMSRCIKDKLVIDIGCGSGILSIAAILLKAKCAVGIDICTEALLHSRKNAELNSIEHLVLFTTSLNSYVFPQNEEIVILMNMIQSEQKLAWKSNCELHNCKATIFTSGILASEKDSYLSLTNTWGWILQDEKQEGEWLSFRFVNYHLKIESDLDL